MNKPRIVCLCGSAQFDAAFRKANREETMAGRIVLSIGFFGHSAEQAHGEKWDQKTEQDELRKRKIDLSDEVLILNVGGYIGDSTRGELDYAIAHCKDVRFLEPDVVELPQDQEES